jgi:hypothetical protein
LNSPRGESSRLPAETVLFAKPQSGPVSESFNNHAAVAACNYSGRFSALRQEGAAIEGVAEVLENGQAVFTEG